MANARSMPVAPLFERSMTWIKQTLSATGAQIQLGLELYPIFLAAGLPGPSMRVDALIGGGPQCPLFEILAELIQSSATRDGETQDRECGGSAHLLWRAGYLVTTGSRSKAGAGFSS